MRFALLATSSLVILALASYACSSSDDPVTPSPDAGKTNTSSGATSGGDGTSGSNGDDGDTTSGGTSSGGTSSSGTSGTSTSSGDGGNTSSSGDAGNTSSSGSVADSGTPVDGGDVAGNKCNSSDQQEKDDTADNTTAGAQVLTTTKGPVNTSFCGHISSATDVDHFSYTFNINDGVGFHYSIAPYTTGSPQPKIVVVVGGTEYEIKSGVNPMIKPGEAFYFKASSSAVGDYRLDFTVTQP